MVLTSLETLNQLHQALHLADPICHPNLHPGPLQSDDAHEMPARDGMGSEDVLDPSPNSGFCPVRVFPRIAQRIRSRAFLADLALDIRLGDSEVPDKKIRISMGFVARCATSKGVDEKTADNDRYYQKTQREFYTLRKFFKLDNLAICALLVALCNGRFMS